MRIAGIGMTSARTRDRLVQRLREQGITNPAVLDRIRNVPRHIFVDEALGSRAYEDTALPIGFGQTISQPYIVARMTEALLEGGPLAQGARDRHRLRLSDRGARAAGHHALHHRAHRAAAGTRARALEGTRACAMCASATAMAASAGKPTRPSMASWWRPRRSRVPEALLQQLSRAAGSSCRWGRGRAAARALYTKRTEARKTDPWPRGIRAAPGRHELIFIDVLH